MRRRLSLLAAIVGGAAVPSRSSCRKLLVFFFACLLIALTTSTPVSAKKPKPQPEVIGEMGTTPIGVAIFPDGSAYLVFGPEGLSEMAEEFERSANDVAIRSDVAAMFVVTTVQNGRSPTAVGSQSLEAPYRDSAVRLGRDPYIPCM